MKLLILSLVLFIWSDHVLTLQTFTNVEPKSFNSQNPVLSSDVNANAYEICVSSFPEGTKLDPASSYYINDGCTVACLVGIDQWHKFPNQIGKPCPFNLHGTCDTDGSCHNEGPLELGQLSLEVDYADFHHIQLKDDQYYFVVIHIRNSSEPWPLASMALPDSAAHCTTPTVQGPWASWGHTCDKLSSFLFKDISRIFLYVYAHQERDPYNNILVGGASATIFEILQGDRFNTALQLEDYVPAKVWINVNFTTAN